MHVAYGSSAKVGKLCIPGHKAGRAPQPGVHGAMPPWIEAKKKAAGCTLRQNTAQIGLTVAEVAEDKETNPIGLMLWMDGQDETADEASDPSWSNSRVGHSTGDGHRWMEAIARPSMSERICSAHRESGASTSAGQCLSGVWLSLCAPFLCAKTPLL